MDDEDRPVVAITGAAGGVGSAVARLLVGDCRVVGLVRRPDSGGIDGVEYRSLDLSDLSQADGCLDGLERLDALVHCAAVADRFATAEADASDWRRMVDIDLIGPALLTRAALPLLTRARGRIVFVNSGAGMHGIAGHAVYAAVKHALRGLADSLRDEVRGEGVKVTTVFPGPTRTAMLAADQSLRDAQEEPMAAESVADTIRYVLTAPEDVLLTDLVVRPQRELG